MFTSEAAGPLPPEVGTSFGSQSPVPRSPPPEVTLSHKSYFLLHPPPSTVNFLHVLFSFHSGHKGTSQVIFSVPTWPQPPLLTSRGCCLLCSSHSPHKFFLDTCLIKQTVGSLFPESLYFFPVTFPDPFFPSCPTVRCLCFSSALWPVMQQLLPTLQL